MNRPEDPSRDSENTDDCRSEGCGCGPIPRRAFIKISGFGAAAAGTGLRAIAGPFQPGDTKDHTVPADKKLKPEWAKMLFERGGPTVYSGKDLETIGMPVGGVCAGQLYLAGDGRLVQWDIFNQRNFSGYGRDNYQLGRKAPDPLRQGFALRVAAGGKTLVRSLDADGFPAVRFCGEYPIGTVEYEDKEFPVRVKLEAFSPFVPLNAPDSALPATVMQFTLTNTSDAAVEATLAGWLENGVCPVSGQVLYGTRLNAPVRFEGATMILCQAKPAEAPKEKRPPVVLADFEGNDYGGWTVEGKSFGAQPAKGTLAGQQEVSGFEGKGLVNTFLGGDGPHGKLTSPVFKIERPFVSFLVGGGNHKGKTCVNLLVDDKVVQSAEGTNNERLQWNNWNVREMQGKDARIEIVDQESGPWGHINIDQIELRDEPRSTLRGPLQEQSDFGTMGLALLDSGPDAIAAASLAGEELPAGLFTPEGGLAASGTAEKPFGQPLVGAVGKRLRLGPGQQATVTFLVAWHFPNRPEDGNFYATRHRDASHVTAYIAENFDRLSSQTRLWHDTWYDATLPHWLLDRLFSTVSTLATGTCQWRANGRFWAWEGVGCCHGTCTHVWNYEHAMARLFPQLERSVRVMQDYNPEAGFVPETGMIRFRGEGWKMWAADGQAGSVLKAYREHLISADDAFLKQLWPRVRKSLEFLINEDQNGDGLIEGSQHNTYDINFYGPNTMVGSLYLAALRAGEEMALEMGDGEFARTCRRIFESGQRLSTERLFDGEYFFQEVDLQKHPKAQYGHGCLSDQLFGQGWAHQVGLGYVYPRDNVLDALRSVWKYNWTPDIGPHNELRKPERWFASPGEAGLFTCTWPKSPYLPDGVRYKNEVWTGIEYQLAGNMAWDGMLTEALALCRAVHERYHPAKHNPFNEIECGDHYARGMASYGVFLGLCGFEYHGPRGHVGLAPRLAPKDFRAAFTAAEGWGTVVQTRSGGKQTDRLAVKWGKLRVKTLALELPEGAKAAKTTVQIDGQPIEAKVAQDGTRLEIALARPATIEAGSEIVVTVGT